MLPINLLQPCLLPHALLLLGQAFSIEKAKDFPQFDHLVELDLDALEHGNFVAHVVLPLHLAHLDQLVYRVVDRFYFLAGRALRLQVLVQSQLLDAVLHGLLAHVSGESRRGRVECGRRRRRRHFRHPGRAHPARLSRCLATGDALLAGGDHRGLVRD